MSLSTLASVILDYVINFLNNHLVISWFLAGLLVMLLIELWSRIVNPRVIDEVNLKECFVWILLLVIWPLTLIIGVCVMVSESDQIIVYRRKKPTKYDTEEEEV